MSDGIGLAEALLGLDDFAVLAVEEGPEELVVHIETKARVAGCGSCGTRAVAHDRMEVACRDLPCFGRPARLIWHKRRWRCADPDCETKTWTEAHPGFASRCLLTRRAAVELTRQVGENARPVAELAEEAGVCWATAMAAVVEVGTPLVEDPERVGVVRALGIDETLWLSARRRARSRFVTGMVDLERRVLVDLVLGNDASALRKWTSAQDGEFLSRIEVVAMDLTDSYRLGLWPDLAHVRRVADGFHVVRLANQALDKVRRRVQRQTTGRRGGRSDPLFRIRKLLLAGAERLDESGRDRMLLGLRVGDPDGEINTAWLAKESTRDIYLTSSPSEAEILLEKTIRGARAAGIPELATLARTLDHWRFEILEHHRSGASNGPTEALNLCVKRVKRCGHGFTRFEHYRLRVLLHAGGVRWPARPCPPRIRARSSPHSNA